MLELQPKKSNYNTARLVVHALQTAQEKKAGFVARKVLMKPYMLRQDNDNSDRDTEELFFV